MALNEDEMLLVEAVKSYLQQEAQLGLAAHEKDEFAKGAEGERGLEHLHNNINDLFALKSAELDHADAVRQAFGKVHSYKYLDDPSFPTAMEKEMVAQAVPADERQKAIGFISKIIDEVSSEDEWAEKDSGFNPNLDEIEDISQPEVSGGEFKIIDKDGYNDGNVDFDMGDASMGHTPDSSENNQL